MTTKQTPSVTVVVPVYNSATTLARAVRSVLEQTLHAFELLIIDDKSTDDSLAVATSLAATDARITVMPLPHHPRNAPPKHQ